MKMPFVPHREHSGLSLEMLVKKMLYRDIMAIWCEIPVECIQQICFAGKCRILFLDLAAFKITARL
jgi:hypothetical protein